MKKPLSSLLCILLLLSLTACQSGGSPSSTEGISGGSFRVGYGRVDITPYEESVPLAGYGNTSTRMSTGCADRLYSTCIAFTEGNQTVLLMTHDQIGCNETLVGQIKEGINAKTGIPKENILIVT